MICGRCAAERAGRLVSHAPRVRSLLGGRCGLRSKMTDSQREKFVVATKELVSTLNGVVEDATKKFSQMEGLQIPKIMSTKGYERMIRPTMTAYWKWLQAVGVSTRNELEEVKKSFGDDKDVLECMQELHATETQFSELRAKLDAVVQKEEDKVS